MHETPPSHAPRSLASITASSTPARIGCLYVPDLPLQALLRSEPDLGRLPVALMEGEGTRARVQAATLVARAQGVLPGQALQEAQALCPELILRWEDEARWEEAREAVLDAAAQVAPKVEELRPGLALIGAEGLRRLHGSEEGIAKALAAAAERLGFTARVAVASGKRVAAVAAVQGEGVEIVAPGQERAFLAPLSLRHLGASPALVETLHRWGIETAGAFAALPVEGVATRLGAEGARLHRLANGIDDEPLQPRPPPQRFEESSNWDHEVVVLEGLIFLLRPLLERLVDRLDCHAFSCGGLELHLALEPAGTLRVPVEVAAPTRDLPTLISLCRSALERHPTHAPVRGLRVVAQPASARREQLQLFGRPTVAPEKLATAVAKVAALLGDDRVGSARPEDSHRHEAFAWERFDPPQAPNGEEKVTLAEPVGGLRLFRPPLAAEVRMERDRLQAIQAGGVVGWVVSYAGPWRLDVGWYGADTARRDLFDVELSDGAVYRLARELDSGAWLVLGRYD